MLEVAARAFYARKDALRPLVTSFLNTVLFIGGGAFILLRWPEWGAPGIALLEMAFTIEATIQAAQSLTDTDGHATLCPSYSTWAGLEPAPAHFHG